MFSMVMGLFGLDRYIKNWIEKQPKKIIKTKGKCTIKKCHNKGAMYSLGEQEPETIKNVSFIMLLFVFFNWMKTKRKRGHCLEKVSWSFFLAGSLGNVWDRFKKGYVVDYMHIDCKILRNIVFNFADVCIAIGGVILMMAESFNFKKR